MKGQLIAIGALANALGGKDQPTSTSTGEGTPGAAASTQAPSITSSESGQPKPTESGEASEATSEEPADPSISNGDHIVGTDVQPGQYRAEVEDSIIPLCTVSQSADGNVLDIRNANEGSVIFTIQDRPGTVVSFSGCANIALAADVIRANPESITNGYWLVGSELAPGQYRGVVDTDSVVKLGTASQTSAGGDVMDIRNANDGSVVFTVKDSKGSVVSFSGFKEISKVG